MAPITRTSSTRQRDKIVAALAAIDADVVGLIEIENNDLADSTATPSSTWSTA